MAGNSLFVAVFIYALDRLTIHFAQGFSLQLLVFKILTGSLMKTYPCFVKFANTSFIILIQHITYMHPMLVARSLLILALSQNVFDRIRPNKTLPLLFPWNAARASALVHVLGVWHKSR
uniref:Uncharacterized protein n=1 Tax=Schistocephalus solidus TaxID=70667 RepID=A0A0V0J1G6_SCHSO